MKFSEILEIKNGRNQRQVETANGKYPIYGSGGVMGRANDYICKAETVVIGRKGSINTPIFVNEPFWNVDTAFGLVANRDIILPKYLFYFCVNFDFERLNTTVTIPSLTKANLLQIEIKVPSLPEQEKIVSILDRICGLIDLRQQQLNEIDQAVKSRFVEMFGEPIANTHSLPLISLSEVGSWNSGGTPSRSNPAYYEGDIDWYSAGELNTLYLEGSVEKITQDALENSTAKLFPAGSMLVGMYDTAAFKMGILKWSSASNQACACIAPNNSIDIVWLYHVLQIMKPHFLEQRRGIRQKNLNLGMIKSFQIPYASKPEQNRFAAFVAEVDKSKFSIQKSLSTSRKLWC